MIVEKGIRGWRGEKGKVPLALRSFREKATSSHAVCAFQTSNAWQGTHGASRISDSSLFLTIRPRSPPPARFPLINLHGSCAIFRFQCDVLM